MPYKVTITGDTCGAVLQNLKEAIMNDDERSEEVSCFFMTILLHTSHEKQQLP
jgi:hypothetical protein